MNLRTVPSVEDVVNAIAEGLAEGDLSVKDREIRAQAVRLVLSEERLRTLLDKASRLPRRGLARTEQGRLALIATRFLTRTERQRIDTRTLCLAMLAGHRPTKVDEVVLRSSATVAKASLGMAVLNVGLGGLLIATGVWFVVGGDVSASGGVTWSGITILAVTGLVLALIGGTQAGKLRERAKSAAQVAAIAHAVAEGVQPASLLDAGGLPRLDKTPLH